ncbi:hypothetical protein PVK06_046595 [Gossypium arboreum]|uniref:Uncharacterized protein n=1 Tax=Gossypium arboreum TaxID=29729 RepID=A0ABR0MBG1_GOSAR|nr:hypothetical protein PVK06_046595 [Gossypium arboreum]
MLGRGGSPLGNVVGSGGRAPRFGRLGKDGNGGKEKGIGGIAVGIVGTEGMLGRGGSPVGNVVGSGGSAPGHGNDGRDGVGRLGKDGVTGIDQNELVQLVRTKIFTSVEKGCWVFRNVIEIEPNKPRIDEP